MSHNTVLQTNPRQANPLSVIYRSSFVKGDLLNNLLDAVITTDTNFLITGLNNVSESLYGVKAGDVVKKSIFDLVKFELVGVKLEEAIEKLTTEGHWNGDVIYKFYEQKLIFNLRCSAIKNYSGKIVAFVFVHHNISETKKQEKKLDAILLDEQVQKQKQINQAIIKAQENERNRISGELHDNVNQLLMSARLHVAVAKTSDAEAQAGILDKASGYLLMAVEEIRRLSKTLNTEAIEKQGLEKSIQEIADNMLLTRDIDTHCFIDAAVPEQLSSEQQLMVYRIVQEQTSNIIKYAKTKDALISLKETDNNFELIVSDNGKGFDKTEEKLNGIGFINIFNRVNAYNGTTEIITAPGDGCTLHIRFPKTQP
jgi:PAS domain S-box-containing protein